MDHAPPYRPHPPARGRHGLRRLRLLLAGSVATTMWLVTLSGSGQAIPDHSADTAGSDVADQAGASAYPDVPQAPSELGSDPVALTLITGDVVHFTDRGEQDPLIQIERNPAGGTQDVEILNGPDGVFVIPDQAQPLVATGTLDRGLFDVRYLAENGYAEMDTLPLIITYEEPTGLAAAGTADLTERAAGLDATVNDPVVLESINGAGVSVDRENVEDFWSDLVESPSHMRATAEESGNLSDGIDKVWLDRKVVSMLDDSREQIGAPQAWESGFDGTGVTVAVLDSGYDATHPDLAGQVTEAVSFVPGEGVADRGGHGTHVASIVAGTGAASDGRYAGVAPGADLAVGRVFNDAGQSQESWIISGMEWAAEAGDVVNMSLGSYPNDGTDPVSLALNELTEETGTLFVVAAGNFGFTSSVSAPATADAALAVAAVDNDDETASFSSRGPRVGDRALKPEIASPGYPVIAAWAADTPVGPGVPIGEDYIAQAGTSMASPVVAATAALLLQRHPDWDAQQVKAALMSTAVHTGAPVYEQGSGRVDAARVTSQDLFATGKADFGWLDDAASSGEVHTRTLTYTNAGDDDVVLNLDLEVQGRGDPGGDGSLQLSETQLTVPAGGQAEVDLELRPDLSAAGIFSGVVHGSQVDGDARVITAVAYATQGETHQVTVEATDRFGQAPDASNLLLVDLHDPADFYATGRLDATGQAVFQVPPGDYALRGYVATAMPGRPDVRHSTDVFGTDVLSVTDDRTVTVDAAGAVDYDFEVTNEPTRMVATQITQSIYHRTPDGVRVGLGVLSSRLGSDSVFGAIPSEDPDADSVDLSLVTSLGEPLITAELAGGSGGGELVTTAPEWTGRFEGTERLDVVDVGAGLAEDYEGVDVTGRAVLVQTDDRFVGQQADLAQQHGAALMIVTPTSPGTVQVVLTQSNTMPVLGAAHEEGERVRNRIANGGAQLKVTGQLERTFTYTLHGQVEGKIPDELAFPVKRSELAAVRNSYHAEVERKASSMITAYGEWGGGSRYYEVMRQPATRTDYVAAGPGIHQDQAASSHWGYPSVSLSAAETAYRPGRRVDVSWFKAPSHPAGYTERPCTFCRSEAILAFSPWPVGDAEPTHTGQGRYGTTTRAFRDGQEIDRPELLLVPEEATYRIERVGEALPDDFHLLANRSATEWTFRSEAPSEEEIENCRDILPGANACAALPVLLVGYDLPLALDNSAPAGRSFHFAVRADRAKGYTGPRETAGMEVSVSYDDGETWQPADTVQSRDLGYRVRVKHPKLEDTNGFVSLRVEVWDDAGNRTVQVIDRAYALS